MTIYLACLALLSCVMPDLIAQDYCSLTVRVLAPDGRRPGASVYVEEKNGRIQEKEHESGDVRFCDLGGLPVTVRVGEDKSCNQVIVREVPVSWGEPYLLTVTYDPEPCIREHVPTPVPLCTIIFRVANSSGEWVQGAAIHVSSPKTAQLTTDGYGRAAFVVRLGSDVEGSIKTESGRGTFRYTCRREESIHEEYIKLEKQ